AAAAGPGRSRFARLAAEHRDPDDLGLLPHRLAIISDTGWTSIPQPGEIDGMQHVTAAEHTPHRAAGETIGVLGGMSWHSTIEYYRAINERVAAERGGHASARLLLSSLDFAEIRDCQLREDWAAAGEILAREAAALERAGAGSIAIATNLMHKVAPAVEASINVPLVHIGDAVADAAGRAGARTL